MPAEDDFETKPRGLFCSLAEGLGVAPIVDADRRPSGREKSRDRKTASSQPDHECVFSSELHGYLNFNVARLKTANMIAMIQNRTMTRGSGQPFFSKWW